MNSPVEDRLREALAEAGAAIDPSTLRPLRAPERRRLRMDFRLVAVAVAVVLAGVATAAGLGGLEGEDQVVATNPEEADMAVFLCTKSARKEPLCRGRDASLEEVRAVERAVKGLTQVEAVFFVDQASAYDSFRVSFADNKALLDSIKVTDMPMSFRLEIKEGADRREVQQALRGLPGIRSVVDRKAASAEASAERLSEPRLSVFLCGKGSTLPACAAERESRGKDKLSAKRGREATNAQKTAIRKLIEAMPEVHSYVFEDKKAAYENFIRAYNSNKALVEATRVEDMPESFRLVLKPNTDWAETVATLKRQPGVASANYIPCLAVQATLEIDYGLFLRDSKVCPISK
ncbi:permease-like cell division protein FtsX [Nonomuraea turcica]|uniref:permease-like cell division protein FtsX n=1 Tax=Nonomuraea sp. G32 TaxID=3067274 RepID=UPI00273BD821|nr:permease-like cell division protein FtsX [Nonomuraea sp. G32]MDP4503714.1 permease-like cell division protein FtsX [Nonomuraea sp. G32]